MEALSTFLAYSVAIAGVAWVAGYAFGKKRGDTTVHNYNSKHANLNIMPGANVTVETNSRLKKATAALPGRGAER
jgi:hypothetical protein